MKNILIGFQTCKNTTVEFWANGISKDSIYVESNSYITFDENYKLKQAYNFYSGIDNVNKRKKVTHRINLKASSTNRLNQYIESENLWVDKESAKISPKEKGSFIAILTNLGQ
jgi:hypothetical protein